MLKLKANELMIGDKVYYDPNVFNDDEYVPDKPLEVCTIESGEDIDLAVEGCYSGIPLTPEILKKNGIRWGLTTQQEDMMSCGFGVPMTAEESWVWEDEDGGDGVVCITFPNESDGDDGVVCITFPNESDGGQISCDNDGRYVSLVWINDIAVHELQHLLRDVHLYDLAEKFKVE